MRYLKYLSVSLYPLFVAGQTKMVFNEIKKTACTCRHVLSDILQKEGGNAKIRSPEEQ